MMIMDISTMTTVIIRQFTILRTILMEGIRDMGIRIIMYGEIMLY